MFEGKEVKIHRVNGDVEIGIVAKFEEKVGVTVLDLDGEELFCYEFNEDAPVEIMDKAKKRSKVAIFTLSVDCPFWIESVMGQKSMERLSPTAPSTNKATNPPHRLWIGSWEWR